MRSQLGTAFGSFIPISVARTQSFYTAPHLRAGQTKTARERCGRGAASAQLDQQCRIVAIRFQGVSTFTCVSSAVACDPDRATELGWEGGMLVMYSELCTSLAVLVLLC